MALNNDYGFKTVNSDRQTAINGKWPIFGFDVDNMENSFRTTRIIDRSDRSYYNTGNTMPTVPGGYVGYYDNGNTMQGTARELIASYPHGYSFRPMGYYTITGSFTVKCKTSIVQNGSGPNAGNFGGNYNITSSPYVKGLENSATPLYPVMNKFRPAKNYGRLYAYNLGTYIGYNSTNDITVPYDSRVFGASLVVGNFEDPMAAWVSVEVDDTNVNIYMNYAYYDNWYRSYYYDYNQYSTLQLFYDINTRTRMVADTSGSTFDVNVYLAPYSIEEFL